MGHGFFQTFILLGDISIGNMMSSVWDSIPGNMGPLTRADWDYANMVKPEETHERGRNRTVRPKNIILLEL